MRRERCLRTLAMLSICTLALTACHRSAVDRDPGGAATASPMNVRDRMRAEEWDQATEGVDFDAARGLVAVERIGAGDAARALDHLAQANALLETNHIMEALEQYVLAARHDPDLADAYVGIGTVVQRKGKVDETIAVYRTALDRDESNVEARFRLAMALWTASRQDEAIVQMTAVAAADDEFGRAHERLAVWHYYSGDFDAAWIHLHRAKELGQQVPGQLASLLEQRYPDPDAASRTN